MGRIGRVALMTLLSVLTADAAVAAGGDLDPTFGVGGKVWTDAVPDAEAADVTLDADGNVVLLGRSSTVGKGLPTDDVFLVRYDPDGTLDQTFGTGGVTTPLTLLAGSLPMQVGIQSTGAIVVSFNIDGAVGRFSTDGSLDTSFGSSGLAGIGGSFSGVSGPLAIQEDDKVVVVARDDATTEMIMARFDANGSLDSSFGSGGVVATGIPTEFGFPPNLDLAIQPDGKILAMVSNDVREGRGDVTFVRLDATGAFDSSFGMSGVLFISTGLADATRFVRQADGKLLITGSSSNPSFAALERYLESGVIDATFGSAGQIRTIPSARVRDSFVQPDGHIVVVAAKAAVRLAPDGSLDETFGACGGVGGLTGLVGKDVIYRAAKRLADDRFVVAGEARALGSLTTTLAAARFGSAVPIPTCQPGGVGKSKIQFKGNLTDRMRWAWKSSGEVLLGDFGMPEDGTDLIVCALDGSGAFVAAAAFPGGTSCPTNPCWKSSSSTVKYAGRDRSETGYLRQSPTIRAKSGVAGRAKLLYRDKGLSLPLNPLVWPVPFTTRLVTGTGTACWEATFSEVTVTGLPGPAKLKATSD